MTAGDLEAGLVGLDPTTLTPFYVDALGFELTAVLDYPQGLVHRLRRGAGRLKIFYPTPPAERRPQTLGWSDHAGFRYASLHLESNKAVVSLARTVVSAGGNIVSEPTSYGDTKCIALVTDPEHNVLELMWEAG